MPGSNQTWATIAEKCRKCSCSSPVSVIHDGFGATVAFRYFVRTTRRWAGPESIAVVILQPDPPHGLGQPFFNRGEV
jgi:hypothetical protein